MTIKDIVKKYREVYHTIFWSLLSVLLTTFCLLPAVLSAQTGWGPDVRLTYRQGAGRDPRAACCGDTIHLVWWQSYSPGHDEVFYKRSTDAGVTWEVDVLLSEEDEHYSIFPWIAVDHNYVHMVWQQQGVGICYRKSTNGGNSWLSVDTLGGSGDPSICIAGNYVYVVAYQSEGKIVFFKSTDTGNSWLSPQELDFTISTRPRIKTLCSNPNLLILIFEYTTCAVEIYTIRSIDGGNTWIDSQYISEYDSIGSQIPAIDTDDSGSIHITWYDYKYSPYGYTGDIFYRTSKDTGNTWEQIDSLTVMHRAQHSDILAKSNNLHLVWHDDRYGFGANNEIFYRMSTDLGQTWGNETRLTNAEGHSYDPTLTCDGNYLHLFWSDSRDDSIDIAIYYKRKDLSQGISEFEKLAQPIRLFYKIHPTLFSENIIIKQNAWDKMEVGNNQNIGGSNALCFILYIRVYDISGKEMIGRTKRVTEMGKMVETVQIDTRDLSSGVYFVELQAGDVREVHKVVKVK